MNATESRGVRLFSVRLLSTAGIRSITAGILLASSLSMLDGCGQEGDAAPTDAPSAGRGGSAGIAGAAGRGGETSGAGGSSSGGASPAGGSGASGAPGTSGTGGAAGQPSPTLPTIYADGCDAGVSVCKSCAASWKQQPAFTDDTLIGISGSSGTDLWAISYQSAFHFDGTSWTKRATFNGELVAIVAGAPNEVYVARKQGLGVAVARWDGATWSDLPTPPKATGGANVELSLVAPGDLWLGTPQGVERSQQGGGWKDMQFETYVVRAFAARSDKEAWVLGGDLFRYNGAGWVNAGDPYLSSAVLHVRGDGSLVATGNYGAMGTWDGSTFGMRYCDYGDDTGYFTAIASNTQETIAVGVLQAKEGPYRPLVQSLVDGKGLNTILSVEGGAYGVWGDDASGFWIVGDGGLVLHRAP